jgi:hypothetical protein
VILTVLALGESQAASRLLDDRLSRRGAKPV